jgi:hypothetical protein
VNVAPVKMVVTEADAALEVPPPPALDAAPPEAQPPVADASTTEAPPAVTDAAPEVASALISCAEVAAAGTPDRLKDFQWMIQTSFNQAFYDTVTIDTGCKITYQHFVMGTPGNPPMSTTRSVTMSGDDCTAARSWTTNVRFLDVLRTGDNCPYGDGNPGDVFDLTLTDEGRVARKTYLCPEPTVESVRACLRPLVARSFP